MLRSFLRRSAALVRRPWLAAGFATVAAALGAITDTSGVIELYRQHVLGEDPAESGAFRATKEDLQAALEASIAELMAERSAADAAEKAILQQRIDALRGKLGDLDRSYRDALADARRLRDKLQQYEGRVPARRLEAARRALEDNLDRSKADALLAEIEADMEGDIRIAADAAFARGQIAEEEVRWADAARHYARAARLAPGDDTLFKAREFAWRSGDYPSALRLGEELVALARGRADDPAGLATALNEHALTLVDAGRHAEAEPLLREALAIDKAVLGQDGPGYATDLVNLAALLQETGRFAEAEPLLREAVAITARRSGADHPAHATALGNLAGLLQATGRMDEAEPLYRAALEIDASALGKNHPAYATDLNNLAGLLQATGRFAEAEPLYRQAITIGADTLGPDHPDQASRLGNLGGVLRATGRLAEAEPLFREALEIDAVALGRRHPGYATDLSNLAVLYYDMGRFGEARALMEEALAVREAALGPEHPDTATARAALAVIRAKLE